MASDGTVNASEVITQEAVRAEVAQHVEENLTFRAAFREVDATDVSSGSIEIPVEGDNGATAGSVSEGSSYPRSDDEQYDKLSISFTKYGTEVEITDEAIQNSLFDVVANQTENKAEDLARTLNNEAYSLVSADADGDGNLDNLQDASVGDGDGTLTYGEIVDAMTAVEGEDYDPDLLIVNPTGKADLLKSDEFTRASEMGDEVVRDGAFGRVAGMDVMVDTSGNLAAGEAYCFDSDKYGFEAVREDMFTEEYRDESTDTNIIKVRTQRGWGVAYAKAGVQLQA